MLECPHVEELYILPNNFQHSSVSAVTSITTLKKLVVGDQCFQGPSGEKACTLDGWQTIEEIEIRDQCFKYYDSLKWSNMSNLKAISLKGRCFGEVYIFELVDLPSLETIDIGENCCCSDKSTHGDSRCRIANCPKLCQLKINNNCFNNFLVFELLNLESLHSVEIGDNCIANASTFELVDCQSLEKVTIGSRCCNSKVSTHGDSRCRIANCPKLHHLKISEYCFHDCKSFELESVNSLQKLVIEQNCFINSNFSLSGRYIDYNCNSDNFYN